MKKWIISICILLTLGIVIYKVVSIKDREYLGDNYYYLPSYEAIDIGYQEGSIIYKSKTKNVFNNIKVPGEVLYVNYDENFIIAVQNSNVNIKEAKDKRLNYFIIVKKSDIVLGPMNRQNYLMKRVEFGVPNELQITEN